ncbi:hypothetical protein MBLNU13_g02108t1 [Cladosporium sp. NU13]
MMSSTPAILTTLLSLASTAQSLTFRTPAAIEWHACEESYPIPVSCGSILVPLDYTKPRYGESLNLTLKIHAVKEPFQGSIVTDFGGPGVSGLIELKTRFLEQIVVTTGRHYDVIAFDSSSNSSDVALGWTWALSKLFVEKCHEEDGGHSELVDIRDIVVTCLMLAGHSYGTYLVETLAAMFPDRIERMVLGAVLNPHEYRDGWEPEALSRNTQRSTNGSNPASKLGQMHAL